VLYIHCSAAKHIDLHCHATVGAPTALTSGFAAPAFLH
jgi:hypothetical protein